MLTLDLAGSAQGSEPEKRSEPVSKEDYLRIRSGLNFKSRFLLYFGFLAVDLALFCLGLHLLACGSPAGYWAAQSLFPVIFFHHFAILH